MSFVSEINWAVLRSTEKRARLVCDVETMQLDNIVGLRYKKNYSSCVYSRKSECPTGKAAFVLVVVMGLKCIRSLYVTWTVDVLSFPSTGVNVYKECEIY